MDLAPDWSRRIAYLGSKMAIIRFRWDAKLIDDKELRAELEKAEKFLDWVYAEAEK